MLKSICHLSTALSLL